MDIEQFRESCGACGSRTIHFVIDPPFVQRHCARCGRDNSTTWGNAFLTIRNPDARAKHYKTFKPPEPSNVKPKDWRPYVKPWDELSSFERSLHFGPAALHE